MTIMSALHSHCLSWQSLTVTIMSALHSHCLSWQSLTVTIISILTRSQGLMAHLIYLSISFAITCYQQRIPSLLSGLFREVTWLLGGDRLGCRLGVDQERIGSRSTLTFWASDWLREITWVGGVCSQSCDVSESIRADLLPKLPNF